MEQLATLLLAINLYSHNAHNLCKGSLFFADHSFLGELYESADIAYDSVIERMIGLGQTPDLVKIQMDAVVSIKDKPQSVPENKAYFQVILDMKKKQCELIEALVKTPGMYEGTKNLLQDLADKAEQDKYKLGQRIK